MNILFLDIDGVLLPNRAKYLANQTRPYLTVFDPCAVGIVNRVAKDTGARFVIHSSWLNASALISQNCISPTNCVKTHMINQGLNAGYFHEDFEALWRFSGNRWTAINDWLCDHQGNKWVVLDDFPAPHGDYMVEANPNGLIIQTNPDIGVSLDHYKSIIAHFAA